MSRVHYHESDIDVSFLYLTVYNWRSGSRNRYDVVAIKRSTLAMEVIGRELDLKLARQVVKDHRARTWNGKPPTTAQARAARSTRKAAP